MRYETVKRREHHVIAWRGRRLIVAEIKVRPLLAEAPDHLGVEQVLIELGAIVASPRQDERQRGKKDQAAGVGRGQERT